MKFTLKQLILFVTVAAMFIGLATYFYAQLETARRMELQARAMAEAERERALQASLVSNSLASNTKTLHEPRFMYSILHWNIESGGNDPATITQQLVQVGQYDIIGLSGVPQPEVYEKAIDKKWPLQYGFVRGDTGSSDRLWVMFNREKFELLESSGIQEVGGVVLNGGKHCTPLVVRLKDRSEGRDLIVLQVHLSLEDAEFRAQQAGALREWARNQATPIIAIGDYNFDYNFRAQKGNAGFDEFIRDGVWKWIEPLEMIDTSWSEDGSGNDRFPDTMLEFNFVAGAAKHWQAKCRVIVRQDDFPDNDKTSAHRPVELILSGSPF